MADAVAVTTITDNFDTLVVHLTNICDGTGEAAVKKVDKSAFLAPGNAEPSALHLVSARWCIYGFTNVQLVWDHDTDVLLMAMAGSGYEDFGKYGGMKADTGTGGAGDVLLTTVNNVAGNTYDITLCFRKAK